MKRTRTTQLAALAGLALTVGSTHAELVVYEPFDYPTGALAGNGPATGLTGSWSSSGSNQQSVVSPGLSFTGLSTTGNAIRRTSAPGGAESSITIAPAAVTALTADDTTIYFSLLVRNDRFSVSNENLAFVIGSGPLAVPGTDKQNPTIPGGQGFGIHLDGNTDGGGTIDIFGYAIDDGVASQSTGKVDNDSSVNTFMIVGRIDWVANGSTDTLTLWNVTDPTADLPASPFATMTADLDQSLFATLAVESQQVASIDEIRFGTTLESVGVSAAAPASTFQVVITPNGDDFDFSWSSQDEKLYDLVTSTDLAAPISNWPVYQTYSDIAPTPPTNTLTAVPGDGPKRFFAVVEKDAPPPAE